MYASKEGHTESVKMLLDAGAAVDGLGGRGQTPLMSASRGGHTETVKILLDVGAEKGKGNVIMFYIIYLVYWYIHGYSYNVPVLNQINLLIYLRKHQPTIPRHVVRKQLPLW